MCLCAAYQIQSSLMSFRSEGNAMLSVSQRVCAFQFFLNWFALYCFVRIFLFFFFYMMQLQTLPVQGEAKKVMVLNTFSFPSTCLRQMYRITSTLKRFFN